MGPCLKVVTDPDARCEGSSGIGISYGRVSEKKMKEIFEEDRTGLGSRGDRKG